MKFRYAEMIKELEKATQQIDEMAVKVNDLNKELLRYAGVIHDLVKEREQLKKRIEELSK